MKAKFYDVKTKSSVEATVIDAVTYERGARTSYALKGTTADKRPLTAFVKKEVYDKAVKALKK